MTLILSLGTESDYQSVLTRNASGEETDCALLRPCEQTHGISGVRKERTDSDARTPPQHTSRRSLSPASGHGFFDFHKRFRRER
jgi:hypothetical protein